MKNTKQTQLNCIAHNVRPPKKPRAWEYKGATQYLNKNRAGVEKLRKRGFSWSQIAEVFEKCGIPVNYNNLYMWQRATFQQRRNNAPKVSLSVGDTIKLISKQYCIEEILPDNNFKIRNTKSGKSSVRKLTNKTKFTKIAHWGSYPAVNNR